jgi:Putative peptidoglycan binding domain
MGKYHQVAQGECFSSLAHRYGFESYRTIYNHPENAEIIKQRFNPNILFPDDVVFIPDNELKEVDAATEQLHHFVLIREKTMFRLVVKDENEKPFADTRYELTIDKEVYEGTTDSAGKIEQEIKANARSGQVTLYVKDDEGNEVVGVLPVEFGHLDPVAEATGVQARLNNLGFECGKPDGVIGEKTQAALLAFQKKHGLPESGECCAATREKLRQTHDWQ